MGIGERELLLAERSAVVGGLVQRGAVDGKRVVAVFWGVAAGAQLYRGYPDLQTFVDDGVPLEQCVVIVAAEECDRLCSIVFATDKVPRGLGNSFSHAILQFPSFRR